MANPYLTQRIKGSGLEEYINMREAEVEVLRKTIFELQMECFEYKLKNKSLASHLYRLTELILAGEGNTLEAQEIAQKAWALLFDKEGEDENM